MCLGLGGRLFKGVEIHHYHIDRLDAVFRYGRAVQRILPPVQDSAVNFGMQCFNTAIEHLRKSGELRDVFHPHARIAQQLGSAACGDEFHTDSGQFAGEFHQPGFVGNTENGTLNPRHS